jgi:hypothetical protein
MKAQGRAMAILVVTVVAVVALHPGLLLLEPSQTLAVLELADKGIKVAILPLLERPITLLRPRAVVALVERLLT